MNLVLTGFMGTGKTAVGRRVADALHVPFYDVDTMIERQAGQPVRDVFASKGEAAFRELESAVIEDLSSRNNVVIATGGGALINAKNRENLQRHGLLVCLTARTGTLLERLKDDLTRPLLAGEEMPQKIDRLMKERESVYAVCPLQIATDGKTISEVATEIIQKITPQWQVRLPDAQA